jgi:hypothetical protein
MQSIEQTFREILEDTTRRKFIENLLVIEDKSRARVPFKLNPIQLDANQTATGRDIYVKPAQVGFSSERLACRFADTVIVPGTNTVLIAYEDFITERLLSKMEFYYNYLNGLGIPGFPEVHHDSTYEKTYRFYVQGQLIGKSSIYIASARSFVAGRAETIHHLLCDEFAFWDPKSMGRIFDPALDRVPPDGTVDVFSTPNGQDNDFYEMYSLAKEGKSVFTPHFYPWYMHPEYQIRLGDNRITRFIPETNREEFELTQDEERLHAKGVTYNQIRWRRWKYKEKESLRRSGELAKLFQQEFPEDDVSCFLAAGDMYYDVQRMNDLAKDCYEAPKGYMGAKVWWEPMPGRRYMVCIDPGQAKVTQSAITVITFVDDRPYFCARDAGLYLPEETWSRAVDIACYYNHAEIVWEANSHGLAISALSQQPGTSYPNVYYRTDVVDGQSTDTLGWLTTSRNKDYMLHQVAKCLHTMDVHDLEVIRQLRNIRILNGQPCSVGADDIFMSLAIGLCCFNPHPVKKGLVGTSGWRW